MFQSANIAASVTNLWRANVALSSGTYTPPNTGLVPGGLRYAEGIGKVPLAAPYADMEIVLDGEPNYMSGNLYVQNYKINIKVWSNSKLENAGDIQAAMESLMGATTKLNSLTGNAWTLYIGLRPAGVEEEKKRANQQNIFVAGATWIIRLQENRT